MKKIVRKTIALFCTAIMLIGMCSIPTEASTARKCYLIKNQNTTVYANRELSKKYGTIWGSDEITVSIVTSKYCVVSYPVSGGRSKTGYIPTSAILTATGGNTYSSSAQIKTYRRPGGNSYGYISKGDQVMILGTYGNYTQVKYPVSGGYKYAFITTSNANVYLKSQSANSNDKVIGNTKLSYGLYKSNSAYITCGFDGYVTQSGRHEGIDIKYAVGKPVYSLTDGIVVRVDQGFNGSKGLSTIAIYNSATDKTVIYLHSAPYNLHAGQSIKKGQQIAKEAWRGIKNSSGAHTHVEVRNGRKGYACKSVGDYKLENQNPTSFWNDQGYSIK